MSKQTNLAYDLSRYEYHKAAPEPKREQMIKRSAKVAPKGFSAVKTVAAVALAGALMCFVLYGKAEETCLQAEITTMTKAVDVEYSNGVRMKAELDGRTSIESVEDYAENVLGLKKLDKSQVEYVSLQNSDVIEIAETESNAFVNVKNKFYELMEYLGG